MTEASTRVGVPCPACSPEEPTVHEVLAGDGRATLRCLACSHVHKARLPEPRTVDRRVIVSHAGESTATATSIPAEETLAVGEEFVVETDEALHEVRITALELEGDRRTDRARAEDVRVVWTRVVDNVAVNATVHPADGRRDESRSVTVHVPGDHEFVVGATETVDDRSVRITGLHLADDARDSERSPLTREGDAREAKDVKRLYAREESSDAWSAW